MENEQSSEGTNDENALAQQYYDLAVITIKPKIKEYLNLSVPEKVLKQRINEGGDYYIKLSDVQYEISKLPPGKKLKYTKTGETKPEIFEVKTIDTQAKNWLNRLSTTITFMVIKQSEYNVKNSVTRDVFFFILSIIFSFFISWSFSGKEIKLPFTKVNQTCCPAAPVINNDFNSINNSNTETAIE